MASEKLVSESIDPLSGLIGPSLFPRAVRASADGPVPSDFKDLVSIHNYIKSLELRSPEKLMNEAKRIVDGGVEILESNLVSITCITDAIAANGKDKPQERRPGLDRASKRAQFSLKINVSQPSVSLKPSLNIDQLPEPDDFWDACDRVENAKKEIQKQLGGSTDNFEFINQQPATNARRRRPGILRKSYNYKHCYSSAPSENNDILMPSQETVDQDIPDDVKDDSQEKLIEPDRNPDMDLEEVELAVPTKKTENEVSHILDDLLSLNNEDLDEDRALDLLQERLKIKPLDRENLYIPELHHVGKSQKSSLIIDSVLKSLNRKPPREHEQVANTDNAVSSPTPPRSPFASLSLLKKKILQSNPLRDPFSIVNIDFSARQNTSPIRAMDKLHEQVDASKDLGTSNELESHIEVDLSANRDASPTRVMDKLHEQVDASKDLRISSEFEFHEEVDITEPTVSKIDTEKVMPNADNLPEQFVDENVSKDITEPAISNIDSGEVIGNADNFPEQLVDGNVTVQIANSGSRPSKEPDNNIEKTVNSNDNQSSPSVIADEAMDDPSSRQQNEPKQQPEVHQAKLKRGKRKAGEKHIRKAHPIRKSLADESMDDPSSNQQIDQEQQHEIPRANLQSGKREAGEKRIRKAHPMRKSLADAGTSFDNGVRRSKRIKSRPLEYWKGERFLYARVDDSLKLLGVKYFSPGKGDDNPKVKPYISSDGYKELLEMAARY